MRYQVRSGESPTLIARRYGVPFNTLISANSHKPTTMVNGRRTWQSVGIGEEINVPMVGTGMVGASADQIATATTMATALAAHGYKLADQPIYMAFQRAMGSTADGFPGSGTMGKLQTILASAGIPMPNVKIYPWHASGSYDGVNAPTSAEWHGAGGGAAPMPTPASTPSTSLVVTASAAVSALNADSSYCASVARSGSAVNTAVHNFKAAWNAANPSNPVPIGTGKYEPVVAQALSTVLGGVTVPSGCGAGAAPPASPPPATPPGAPPPSSAYNNAQVTAALAMNAALDAHGYKQADQPIYRAFQSAMGSGADGFPGTGTMAKLQAVLASTGIPMASVKVYPWLSSGHYDGVNAPTSAEWTGAASGGSAPVPDGGAAAAAAAAAKAAADAAAKAAADATTQAAAAAAAAAAKAASDAANKAAADAKASGDAAAAKAAADAAAAAKAASDAANKSAGGGQALTPPTDNKISTGAMVLGAIGAVALVGVIAMAASSGKKTPAHHGGGAPHHPGHKPERKHTTHKKTAHKPKRKKKK